MRHMRMHEALLEYGGKNLFCLSHGVTKQIFIRGFWHFCLILPHKPHEFRIVKMVITKNMRIMRMYEEGIFKGFCLPCIEIGKGGERRTQKYEAVMREYEDDPHIFGGWERYIHPNLLTFLLSAFRFEGGEYV